MELYVLGEEKLGRKYKMSIDCCRAARHMFVCAKQRAVAYYRQIVCMYVWNTK